MKAQLICGLKAHFHDKNTTAMTIFLDAVVDCSWLPLNTHPVTLLILVLSHVEVLAAVIVEKCTTLCKKRGKKSLYYSYIQIV